MPAIDTRCYALVVIQHGDRFVLVQETDTKNWYLPAGRVEAGETFLEGARRETREEAGLEVELTGILRVEHTPMPDGTARLRVIFSGRATSPNAKLKSTEDEHSSQARWFTVDEARALPLRGSEVIAAISYVAAGKTIHPLTVLTAEGAPF